MESRGVFDQFDDADAREIRNQSVTMASPNVSDQFDDADGDSVGNQLIELTKRCQDITNSCYSPSNEKHGKEGSSIISSDSNSEGHSPTLVPTFRGSKITTKKKESSVLISNDSPLRNKTISLKFDNSSLSDDSSVDTISKECKSPEVTENDVLCGRGHGVNNFIGNRRFRDFAMFFRESFSNCKPKTKEQRALCQHILQSVHFRGGRFLIQDDRNKWVELEDEKAIKKVSQLLRGTIGRSNQAQQHYHKVNAKKMALPSKSIKDQFGSGTLPYASAEAKSQIEKSTEDENSVLSANSNGEYSTSTPTLQRRGTMKPSSETSISENSTVSDNSRCDSTFSNLEGVGENDILCGKGWSLNNFIGNRRYRDFAMKFCDVFSNCENRQSERREICEHVVQAIYARGGRFLTKDDKDNWVQLEDEKAMRKVSQLLRTSITDIEKAKQRCEKTKLKKMALQSNTLSKDSHKEAAARWNKATHQHRIKKSPSQTSINDEDLDRSIYSDSKQEDPTTSRPTLRERDARESPNPKAMDSSSLTTNGEGDECVIGEPREDDVLYGRGSRLNDFVGNRRYRVIAMAFRDIFANPSTRQSQKWEICNHIVKAVQNRGGRFLIKDERSNWTILEYKKVVKKVNQLLRDNVRVVKKATQKCQEAKANKMDVTEISPTAASIEKKIILKSNTISQELSEIIARCDRETKKHQEIKAKKLALKLTSPLNASLQEVSEDTEGTRATQQRQNRKVPQLDLLSTAAASIELNTTVQVNSSSQALKKIIALAARQFQERNVKKLATQSVSPTMASVSLQSRTLLKARSCNVFATQHTEEANLNKMVFQTISPTMASLERKSTGRKHFATMLLGQHVTTKGKSQEDCSNNIPFQGKVQILNTQA